MEGQQPATTAVLARKLGVVSATPPRHVQLGSVPVLLALPLGHAAHARSCTGPQPTEAYWVPAAQLVHAAQLSAVVPASEKVPGAQAAQAVSAVSEQATVCVPGPQARAVALVQGVQAAALVPVADHVHPATQGTQAASLVTVQGRVAKPGPQAREYGAEHTVQIEAPCELHVDPGTHAVQVAAPAAAYVPAAHCEHVRLGLVPVCAKPAAQPHTVFDVSEHGVTTTWFAPHEAHVEQVAVEEPSAEYVPAAHAAQAVFDEAEHGTTRWPGPHRPAAEAHVSHVVPSEAASVA